MNRAYVSRKAMGTLTLHDCAYVVVEDFHQLLGPSVHVHGCAELLSHLGKTCKKCSPRFLGCLEEPNRGRTRGPHWRAPVPGFKNGQGFFSASLIYAYYLRGMERCQLPLPSKVLALDRDDRNSFSWYGTSISWY